MSPVARATGKLLTRDEARRIAANIAKLRAAKCSSSAHHAKIRAHPSFATRFGVVSDGGETHGWRVSLTTGVSASLDEPSLA